MVIFSKGCPLPGSLFVFTLLGLLFLAGCKPGGRNFSLNQAWITQKFVTAKGLELSGNQRLVRFYDDGTYTMYGGRSGYDRGYWRPAEKTNYLVLHPVVTNLEWIDAYWQYLPISQSEMKVTVYRNPLMQAGTDEGFYMMKAYSAGRHDPFHPDMNAWRIAPDTTESLDEIRQRVLDYLRFQQAWYAFAVENELNELPTHWYPQPMIMHYANGVRMAYADELSDWNSCFYDSTAAVRGYQFIGGALREVSLKQTTDMAERNLDCIAQMIEALKNKEILRAGDYIE
jgi:hypothetical protein